MCQEKRFGREQKIVQKNFKKIFYKKKCVWKNFVQKKKFEKNLSNKFGQKIEVNQTIWISKKFDEKNFGIKKWS